MPIICLHGKYPFYLAFVIQKYLDTRSPYAIIQVDVLLNYDIAFFPVLLAHLLPKHMLYLLFAFSFQILLVFYYDAETRACLLGLDHDIFLIFVEFL